LKPKFKLNSILKDTWVKFIDEIKIIDIDDDGMRYIIKHIDKDGILSKYKISLPFEYVEKRYIFSLVSILKKL
jgi:hypothetical protein